MNPASVTVSRPVATAMFFLCVIILGVTAFRRLPVDLMPDVTFPRLTISTEYEGVGPEEVEQLVTRPIERAIASIQGVESIESESGEGKSQVSVAFSWGTDLNEAAQDVRSSLDRIKGILPEDALTPRVFKFDLSALPILFLGVASELDLSALTRFLDERVKYRIERVPGVAAVDVMGARKREIQILLDLDRIRALKISPELVMAAVAGENLNTPAGAVREGRREILIRTEGEYRNLREIEDTVILERSGSSIRVRDIAKVTSGLEEKRFVINVNGKPGVLLFIRKQSGANTVAVARAVMKEVERINADYPQIAISPIVDTSRFISDSIKHIEREAFVGSCLSLVILLLFLNSVVSSLIVATAIPLSIIATFVLIYFSGLTLNIMTFGGLALGVGLLVDNSIVVLENIYRRLEMGDSAREAAIRGAGEVSDAIAASTLTTIAVFLPLIFFTGLAGALFKQMAAVVAFSLLCSLASAAALVPTLCAVFFRKRPRRDSSSAEAADGFLQREYSNALRFSLSRPWLVLSLFFLFFVGSLSIVPRLGFELMPSVDEGTVRINFEAQVGTHIRAMERALKRLESICREKVPELERYFCSAGSSSHRVKGGNEGKMRLCFVPKSKRKRSSEEICRVLREATRDIAGLTIRIRPDSGTLTRFVRRGAGGDRVSLEIRGFDLGQGARLAEKVAGMLEKIDGITDTRISREQGRPELVCRIDRAKAAVFGLSFRRVSDALNTFIAGSTASQFRDKGDEYRIVVRLAEGYRDFVEKLEDYAVITPTGERVFLRSLLTFQRKKGPVSIERRDQERITTVRADYQGRDLASVVGDIRKALAGIAVPKGFEIRVGGEAREQEDAFTELRLGLILAVLLVYMVMAAQFESFSAPFVIMFTMPMGGIGVIAAMALTLTPFSVNAFMGLIMLAGIVVNDAIVLVDAIVKMRNDEPERGLDQVILSAGRRRLRPVLMTTFTTVLALVPIAVGAGEGGEIQAPMARVVIGGLLSATFITLVVVPVVYRGVDRLVTFVFGKRRFGEQAE